VRDSLPQRHAPWHAVHSREPQRTNGRRAHYRFVSLSRALDSAPRIHGGAVLPARGVAPRLIAQLAPGRRRGSASFFKPECAIGDARYGTSSVFSHKQPDAAILSLRRVASGLWAQPSCSWQLASLPRRSMGRTPRPCEPLGKWLIDALPTPLDRRGQSHSFVAATNPRSAHRTGLAQALAFQRWTSTGGNNRTLGSDCLLSGVHRALCVVAPRRTSPHDRHSLSDRWRHGCRDCWVSGFGAVSFPGSSDFAAGSPRAGDPPCSDNAGIERKEPVRSCHGFCKPTWVRPLARPPRKSQGYPSSDYPGRPILRHRRDVSGTDRRDTQQLAASRCEALSSSRSVPDVRRTAGNAIR
jgi:hypothetical protein